MPTVVPKPGIGGYEALWLIPLTLDGDGKISGVAAGSVKLNHVQDLTPTFGINADDAAEAEVISIDSISNTTWEVEDNGETRDLKTGDLKAGGTGGTAGRNSKIAGTGLVADAATMKLIAALRGQVVLAIMPWARTYTAGSEDAVEFLGLVGKVSSDIAPTITGKTVQTIPIEITGGKSYTVLTPGAATNELVLAINGAGAIIAAGDDDGEAGIAPPAVTEADPAIAAILGGDVSFLA